MLLAELLAVSERVAGTRSRLAKIDAIAECLRRLDASEIALGVAYLSGDTRQGRIGIGYAALKDALAATPASAPRLTLAQVDAALARLAQIKGEGSAAERTRLLAELFAGATAASAMSPPTERKSFELVVMAVLRQAYQIGKIPIWPRSSSQTSPSLSRSSGPRSP